MCGGTGSATLVLPPSALTTMRLRSLTALAVCAAAVPAAPAHAFSVSPQAEIRPPARLPVAMPGGYRQGTRIPRRHVLLRRSVAIVSTDGKRAVRFRCPGGKRIRSIAINDGSGVGIELPRDQLPYTRRSRVRLNVYASRQVVGPGETATGRLYVLCGPRG